MLEGLATDDGWPLGTSRGPTSRKSHKANQWTRRLKGRTLGTVTSPSSPPAAHEEPRYS